MALVMADAMATRPSLPRRFSMRCAADASAYWQVNSRRLGEMTERILGLWREGDEALQVPDAQDNRSFNVTQAEARDDLSLFVTLESDHDIRTAEIAVYEEANRLPLNRGRGRPDHSPSSKSRQDRTFALLR